MKNIFIPISIVLALIVTWIIFVPTDVTLVDQGVGNNAVQISGGTQYITITAKGNYSPKSVQATANMPTVLRLQTNGTYDCTSSVTIPKLNYRSNLPPTGITEIPIAANVATGSLDVLCGMGMYSSVINFSS